MVEEKLQAPKGSLGNENVAVVGCGYWGRNLVRNFHQAEELRVVCDSSAASAEFIASKYPATRFEPDYEKVLADPLVKGIAIATPAVSHAEMTLSALRAGKDVFVEKPLALSLDDATRVVEEAERLGRILMVGHLLWYHPAVLKLKELVDSGELGTLRYVTSHRLNFGKLRQEENVLWSFAPHDVSVVLGIVGEEPESVACSGSCYLHKDIVDVTSTELTFPRGVKAHLFTSWLHPFKEQKLVVVGDRRMAVFDDVQKEGKLMLYDHAVRWDEGAPVAVKADGQVVEIDASEPLRNEVNSFLEAIRTRRSPRTDGREGLRVLRVLKSCQTELDREPIAK